MHACAHVDPSRTSATSDLLIEAALCTLGSIATQSGVHRTTDLDDKRSAPFGSLTTGGTSCLRDMSNETDRRGEGFPGDCASSFASAFTLCASFSADRFLPITLGRSHRDRSVPLAPCRSTPPADASARRDWRRLRVDAAPEHRQPATARRRSQRRQEPRGARYVRRQREPSSRMSGSVRPSRPRSR